MALKSAIFFFYLASKLHCSLNEASFVHYNKMCVYGIGF